MQLPHHNRYDYLPINKRPAYSWADGKRLAFYVGVNIEHFSFGPGLRHAISTESPPPDPRTFSWLDYGNRVGVWRLFDLLDEFKFSGCHLVNTTVFDYAPDIAEAIKARGDEFIGHGRTNAERQGHMWEEDERRLLSYVHQQISQHGGKAPRGWIAPGQSQSAVTPDLLQETDFRFVMDWPFDDQPIWMRTRSGKSIRVNALMPGVIDTPMSRRSQTHPGADRSIPGRGLCLPGRRFFRSPGGQLSSRAHRFRSGP